MIWVALYILIACAFVPFTCRYAMDRTEDDYGALSLSETFLCLTGGVVIAFAWPLLVAAWVIERVRA